MKKLQLLMIGALLSVAMLTTSCEKWNPWDDEPGNGGGGGGGGNTQTCTLYGTLVRVQCGVSDLPDNLWIKTENGKYYQPCDASIVHTMDLAYPLQEGMTIQFGYKLITGSKVCDQEQVMLCQTVLPKREKIKLTCIQPVFRCGTIPDTTQTK